MKIPTKVISAAVLVMLCCQIFVIFTQPHTAQQLFYYVGLTAATLLGGIANAIISRRINAAQLRVATENTLTPLPH